MKEEKHINRMYENAICDPSVDAMDRSEIMDSVIEQADMLCLDAEQCVTLMDKRFPQVTTTDFKNANDILEIDDLQ